MNKYPFVLALEAADMDPDQARIIAAEIYELYQHDVLGGPYKPVDYGDFDELRARAQAVSDKKAAMNAGLRAMLEEQGPKDPFLIALEKLETEIESMHTALLADIGDVNAILDRIDVQMAAFKNLMNQRKQRDRHAEADKAPD